jgi:hypothetical protein
MALAEENRLAADSGAGSLDLVSTPRIFRYFKTSPEIIVNAARKLPRTAEVKFPSVAGQGARWA